MFFRESKRDGLPSAELHSARRFTIADCIDIQVAPFNRIRAPRGAGYRQCEVKYDRLDARSSISCPSAISPMLVSPPRGPAT